MREEKKREKTHRTGVGVWAGATSECGWTSECGVELHLRAFTLVVLNSYIVIFSCTKYQNVPYNGGAQTIFFVSIITLLSSWKVKKFYLCVHTTFDYFTNFYSFSILISLLLRSLCYCLWFTLLLLFIFYFLFLYSVHSAIYCFCAHITIVMFILLWCLYYFIMLKAKIDLLILDIL